MLKKGQLVRIHIPAKDQKFARGAMIYNDLYAIIERVVKVCEDDYYYELRGCTGPEGQQFAYLEEWLISNAYDENKED